MSKAPKTLIAVALTLLCLAGLGCKKEEEKAAPAPAAPAKELYFYIWSNYYPPALLRKFEEETGIHVTMDSFDSNETLLAKLQAGGGGYDVAVPSDYMVKTMIELGLLEKIDAFAMQNFRFVKAPLNAPEFDPKREYSAPYMWGTTGFSYDSSRIPGGRLEESWRSILEPIPELKGQIAMLNDEVEVWNAAAYYLGFDKCTEKPEEAEKILEVLEKQKPSVATYNSDGTIERMEAKEVIMHMQWNGTAHRVRKKIPTLVYVYPKEGITFWHDNLVVPKTAKNKENARVFINWMMKLENAAAASNFTGYNNAIERSEIFLERGLREDPAVVVPDEYKDRLRPSRDCSAASRELRNKVWTRLKK